MKSLLVEKYRPSTLDGYIFQNKENESLIRKWVKEKSLPNVIFSGPAGSGKSTIARMLPELLGISKNDVKRINGTLTNGIGFVREELEPWMRKIGFSDIKIVLIEEADRLTKHAQDALRDVTESYSDTVRFIMTANYPHRFTPEMLSRFQHVRMESVNDDGILDLVCDIIEQEGIEVLDENDLFSHVDAYKPDIRKIINSIDKHTDDMKQLLPLREKETTAGIDEWEKLWMESDTVTVVDALKLTETVDMNNFETFYEVMYMNSKKFPDESTGVVLLSQYLDRAYRSANQRIHLEACIYHIFAE